MDSTDSDSEWKPEDPRKKRKYNRLKKKQLDGLRELQKEHGKDPGQFVLKAKEEFNVSDRTYYNLLPEDQKRKYNKLKEEQKDELKELQKNHGKDPGEFILKSMEEFNVGYQTYYNLLPEDQKRTYNKLVKKQVDELIELMHDHVSNPGIVMN